MILGMELAYRGTMPTSRARADHQRPEGLPALVVDEDIYRLAPDLLIGTVDKFAALPWQAATAHLFGHVTTECDRHGFRSRDAPDWCRDGGHPRTPELPAAHPVAVPRLRSPDLIMQDELHLISDALGSMVGLYETLIDRLCTRDHGGAPVRPVLVASTATVRRARAQVQQVFARDLTVFLPPVFDAGNTFFSRRVPPSAATPARHYGGILAPGERLTAVEIRVMTRCSNSASTCSTSTARSSIRTSPSSISSPAPASWPACAGSPRTTSPTASVAKALSWRAADPSWPS